MSRITEAQLESWSNQGAVTTSQATHQSIRNALLAPTSPVANRITSGGVDVYLQGSYRNSTNIRGDSDVDLVVELNTTFHQDISALSYWEKDAYSRAFSSATYTWFDFRADVLSALRACFGQRAIIEGNKSINVLGGNGRLPADVVVCVEYRNYHSFQTLASQSYMEGITFLAVRDIRWIVNYPKRHYDNGVEKNRLTGENYKPAVRFFKNARNRLVENKIIPDGLAPSYFLECMLYNVPNSDFGSSRLSTFWQTLAWLAQTDLNTFICQNGVVPLFGDTPEQWKTDAARQLIAALINYYYGD